MRASRPGQKLQEVYTSKLHNELVKATRKLPPPGKLQPPLPDNPVRMRAYSSSITKDRFDPVHLVDPLLDTDDADDTDPAYGYISVEVGSQPIDSNFGILQGPLNDASSPFLTVLGVTWARFEQLSVGHNFVHFDVSNNLVSHTSGPARIIKPISGSTPVTGIGLILITGPLTDVDPPDLSDYITDIRVNGTALEYEKNNSGVWTNWHTGGTCP